MDMQVIRLHRKRRTTQVSVGESGIRTFDALATYNSECARGIAHTQRYKAQGVGMNPNEPIGMDADGNTIKRCPVPSEPRAKTMEISYDAHISHT